MSKRVIAAALCGLALAGCYKAQARKAAAQAGYDPASVEYRPLGLCMKGREPYTATAKDGRKAKICAGGLFMRPSITPL